MKKIFIFATLIIVLLLSGCFGSPAKTPSPAVNNEKPSASSSPSIDKSSATFEDNSFYIKARNTANVALCAKIQDAALKNNCEKEVKALVDKAQQAPIETDASLDLKAHTTGDIGLCAKIKDATLKTKCTTEVASTNALMKK